MIKTILFLFGFISGAFLHPIHVTVTDMVYNPKTKSIEITHKIFTDDIERHIERIKNINLRLNTPKELPDADVYFKAYLESYFKIKINGKVYVPRYLGKEYETDALWIYTEITNIKAPGTIEITDALLLDLYDDQDNLLHIKVGGHKKSLRFNSQEQKGLVKF